VFPAERLPIESVAVLRDSQSGTVTTGTGVGELGAALPHAIEKPAMHIQRLSFFIAYLLGFRPTSSANGRDNCRAGELEYRLKLDRESAKETPVLRVRLQIDARLCVVNRGVPKLALPRLVAPKMAGDNRMFVPRVTVRTHPSRDNDLRSRQHHMHRGARPGLPVARCVALQRSVAARCRRN
jgi:hypothetical protein